MQITWGCSQKQGLKQELVQQCGAPNPQRSVLCGNEKEINWMKQAQVTGPTGKQGYKNTPSKCKQKKGTPVPPSKGAQRSLRCHQPEASNQPWRAQWDLEHYHPATQTDTASALLPALLAMAAAELQWDLGLYSQHVQSQLGCLCIQVVAYQLPINMF